MLKEEKSTECVLDLSMNAHSSFEKLYGALLNELAEKVDPKFLEQHEKELKATLILIQGGILFGKENPDMSHDEIESRKAEFWPFAHSLIEKYFCSMEDDEGKEEAYTKILLDSIYCGQKNISLKIDFKFLVP